jgi:C4-dicarboxylate transporter, DctQ subunit
MFVLRLYDRLILGLAILGGASLAFITLAIIVDVVLRNTGFRPFQATSAIVEYVMLFATMSAGPWLVRENGHVAIGSFVGLMPEPARLAVGRIVLVATIAILALLCWRSVAVGLEMVASRAMDMRSINIPSWVLYAMLAVGFGLMAIEFLRLLLRGETYAGAKGGH